MASILDRFIRLLPKAIATPIQRRWPDLVPYTAKQSTRSDMDITSLDLISLPQGSEQPACFNMLEKLQQASTPRTVTLPAAFDALENRGKEILQQVKTVTTKEQAKNLQLNILTLQKDISALRDEYTRKFEKNEIPSDIYLFYMEKIDTADSILDNQLLSLSERFTLQPRMLPTTNNQNDMSSIQFSKHVDALEILFEGTQRTGILEEDRWEFYEQGLAILKRLDGLLSAHPDRTRQDEHAQAKLDRLRIEFNSLQRRAENHHPLVSQAMELSSSLHSDKAKMLALIDGLAYAAIRLEASASKNEQKAFYNFGRDILNKMDTLRSRQGTDWQLTAEEEARVNSFTWQFRNAIPMHFGPLSIVRIMQNESNLISTELKKSDLTIEQALALNTKIQKLNDYIEKTRQGFNNLIEQNLLSPKLNDIYNRQLDMVNANLLQQRIFLQGKASSLKQAAEQNSSVQADYRMSQIEFTKKLECLGMLLRAAEKPDLPDSMREGFLQEARILWNDMAPTYHASPTLTWKLSDQDDTKFKKFSADLTRSKELKAAASVASAPAGQAKNSPISIKAEYVATLDALEYVTRRLEACSSTTEKNKYEEQGSLIKQSLADLKKKEHKKLKLTPDEKQREEQLLDRYQTVIQARPQAEPRF